MSDQTETTEADATVTEDAEQSTATEQTTPPPWGDDFNPERAWQTITHLRDRERELEKDAKEFQRLQNDPEAQREWLITNGYEIEEETEAPEGTDQQPPFDPRVDDIEQWRAEMDARLAQEQFDRDLTEEAGERDLSDVGKEWIEQRTVKTGNDRDALTKAVKAWFDYEDTLKPKPKRPAAPHVPSGGEAPPEGAGASTHQDRVQRAMDRLNAEQA